MTSSLDSLSALRKTVCNLVSDPLNLPIVVLSSLIGAGVSMCGQGDSIPKLRAETDR